MLATRFFIDSTNTGRGQNPSASSGQPFMVVEGNTPSLRIHRSFLSSSPLHFTTCPLYQSSVKLVRAARDSGSILHKVRGKRGYLGRRKRSVRRHTGGRQGTIATWSSQVESDEDDGERRVVGCVDIDALVKREQVLVRGDGRVDARVRLRDARLCQTAQKLDHPANTLRWSCRRTVGLRRKIISPLPYHMKNSEMPKMLTRRIIEL
jgi:hypothetical protein